MNNNPDENQNMNAITNELNYRLYELVLNNTNNTYDNEIHTLLQNPSINLLWQDEEDNNTILHAACESGNVQTLDMLLRSGKEFKFTIRNNDGYTPLMNAINDNKPEIFHYLFSIPEFTNEILGIPNTLLMHFACDVGNIGIIQLLHYRMPEMVNSVDRKGRTPFHKVCTDGNIDIAQVLLSFPVINRNAQTKLGETPFFLAVRHNHLPLVAYLLSVDSIMYTIVNSQGYTPLQIACYRENEEMVKLLIESGRIPPNDIVKLARLDNIMKDRPIGTSTEGISFSNSINNMLVHYARQYEPSIQRPPMKERFAPLRIGIKKNINSASAYEYATKTHPSCLSRIDFQNLFTRLSVPPRTAILQYESMHITFTGDDIIIKHHGAFIERLTTSKPFLGTIVFDYTDVGGEGHVCAYLFMNNTLFFFDTAPSKHMRNNKEVFINYIKERIDVNIRIIDVAFRVKKLLNTKIYLQEKEVTGYCTMWSGAFLEHIGGSLSILKDALPSQLDEIFIKIYKYFIDNPMYGYQFYQELASRNLEGRGGRGGKGGAKMTRRVSRNRKRNISRRKRRNYQ